MSKQNRPAKPGRTPGGADFGESEYARPRPPRGRAAGAAARAGGAEPRPAAASPEEPAASGPAAGKAPPNLTHLGEVRALCRRHGFTLSKSFGQNFIVNPGICPKIVEKAGIGAGYGVLEIGPGVGVLTRALAARAARVAAIELDERLFPLLRETLADCGNVRVVPGDAMKLDLAALIRQEFAGLRVAVCANLPYYITSPLVMRLLEERLPIESITVMVQKEAAERLCAAPGSRAAGAISCAVRYYARPQLLFTVQPGSFYPPPRVTSAVIRLELRDAPPVQTPDEAGFFRLVRAAFGQRRKAAANAVSAGLGLPKPAVAAALQQAGLDPLIRPEQLTLQDFCALQRALYPAQARPEPERF